MVERQRKLFKKVVNKAKVLKFNRMAEESAIATAVAEALALAQY
jgi:hypothetical protein